MTAEEKDQFQSAITRSTYVQLSLVVAICGSLILGTAKVVNIERDIADNQARDKQLAEMINKIDDKIVGKTREGWHRQNMYWYSKESERLNPEWKAPNPYEDPNIIK